MGPTAALLVTTWACGGGDAAPARPSAAGAPVAGVAAPPVTVPERWISARDTAWDLDTPAVWVGQGEARVLVTAKGAHDLEVFDVPTGAALSAIGGPGEGPGRFRRPNAVVVLDDLAFVVERDNHRVQVMRMPGGAVVGTFGEDVLERPYGGVLTGALPDPVLWVTDDYVGPGGAVPADLGRRVHRFVLHLGADGALVVAGHAAFGDASGKGALAVVETIGADPRHGRILVADESRKRYLVYDTLGVFTGVELAAGRVAGDPEGMALVRCGDGGGYWIVTDQQPDVSLFRVFRRADLAYLGSFRGRETANTDGVTFAAGPLPGFPDGAFFAVHDDQAVSAFDWGEVRDALGLGGGCIGAGR